MSLLGALKDKLTRMDNGKGFFISKTWTWDWDMALAKLFNKLFKKKGERS